MWDGFEWKRNEEGFLLIDVFLALFILCACVAVLQQFALNILAMKNYEEVLGGRLLVLEEVDRLATGGNTGREQAKIIFNNIEYTLNSNLIGSTNRGNVQVLVTWQGTGGRQEIAMERAIYGR